jgi:hypothetical protein
MCITASVLKYKQFVQVLALDASEIHSCYLSAATHSCKYLSVYLGSSFDCMLSTYSMWAVMHWRQQPTTTPLIKAKTFWRFGVFMQAAAHPPRSELQSHGCRVDQPRARANIV